MKTTILAGAVLGAALLAGLSGTALASPALTLKSGPMLAGPGADYDKLMDLPADMHVDVVWCGTHGNWCLISQHNHMGWLPLAALKLRVGGGAVASSGGAGGHGGGGPAAAPGGSQAAAMATENAPKRALSDSGPSLSASHMTFSQVSGVSAALGH